MFGLSLAATCLLAAPAPAPDDLDALVDEIRACAVVINTLDPLAEDHADLLPLRRALAGVRVLQLGESSHGDGATFVMRRRLVRFLHQHAGFDVLAWESGLAELERLDDDLRGDVSVVDLANRRLARVWSTSGHALPVLDYARETLAGPRPLELAGFDCQSSGEDDLGHVLRGLGEAFAQHDAELLTDEQSAFLADPLAVLKQGGRPQPLAVRAVVDSIVDVVDAHRPTLEAFTRPRDLAFQERTLGTFSGFLGMLDHMMTKGMRTPADNNLRDAIMGNNLAWLARERYPDRKLVTWVASFHAMRNLADLEIDDPDEGPTGFVFTYEGLRTLGDVAHDALGDELYTLGMISHHGVSGLADSVTGQEPYEIPAAPVGSFEDLMHRTGERFLFLDLRGLPDGHPLRAPRSARLMGHSDHVAPWAHHVDGLLFIDEMFPSTIEGEIPE